MKVGNYELIIRRHKKYKGLVSCNKSTFIKWLWKNIDWNKTEKIVVDAQSGLVEVDIVELYGKDSKTN